MSASRAALRAPEEGEPIAAWFARLARLILTQTYLVVGRERARPLEIEFYYYAHEHLDPFAHQDPNQRGTDRWYLHRDAGTLRSGSFKGLDISFGEEGVFGGILVRTLAFEGGVVCGPSLCVDAIIERLGLNGVAALDAALAGRDIWDASAPLSLARAPAHPGPLLATGRVGLTLKRARTYRTMPRYLSRRYRFTSDPRLPKGKVLSVLALQADGASAATIRERTGCAPARAARYAAAWRAGFDAADVRPFLGRSLPVLDLCALYGACSALFGT